MLPVGQQRRLTSVQIRKLKEKDLMAFLAWRTGDDYFNQVVQSEVDAHFRGDRVIFVALGGNQVAGTVQLSFRHMDRDLADGESSAYIQALEVDSAFRRRGIGDRLVAAAEEEAVVRGLARTTLMVEPENDDALRLYLRRGYRPFKKALDVWRGEQAPVVCMVKELGEGIASSDVELVRRGG